MMRATSRAPASTFVDADSPNPATSRQPHQPSNPTATSRLSAHHRAPTLSPEDMKRRVDDINDSFTEAREEIEAAMEAVGTTYFNEEAEYAQEVTDARHHVLRAGATS